MLIQIEACKMDGEHVVGGVTVLINTDHFITAQPDKRVRYKGEYRELSKMYLSNGLAYIVMATPAEIQLFLKDHQ